MNESCDTGEKICGPAGKSNDTLAERVIGIFPNVLNSFARIVGKGHFDIFPKSSECD